MKYRKMNGTGIKVSELCLGTMMFGEKTSVKESMQIIDYALSEGVNFIDTADSYNRGESERIIGKALKGRRDNVILATKVRAKVGDDVNDSGLNRRHILKEIDQSLINLQTDYVDIYYMHSMDDTVSPQEILETMDLLVKSGKVRYVGVSNFPAWQVNDLIWTADKRNLSRPIVTQNMYNVITREVEYELVPCIQRHNMGLTVYNPIAGGLLTGSYDFANFPTEGRFAEKANYKGRYWREENFKEINELKKIADVRGMSLLELSLKWCLAKPYVDAVISGISHLEQIEQNIKAVEGNALDAETVRLCDEVCNAIMQERVKYYK